MSNDAPTWFKVQYNNGVIAKFQAGGFMLQSTVSPVAAIVGTKAYFNIMGKGSANKKRRGQPAIPMNAKKGRVEANLETWEAFDEVWSYDLSRMSANEKEAISDAGAKALGRGVDNELVDHINAKSGTGSATGSGVKPFLDANGQPGMVGGNNVEFGLEHLLTMNAALQQADVPWDGNVFCPLPSIFWNQAMAYKHFNSSDWVGEDLSFRKTTVSKFWNGVHYFLAPDEYFRSPDGSHIDIQMYHKNAAGWANNEKLTSMWQWENRNGCWTIRQESEGAAAILLPEGMVRGRFKLQSGIALK